MKQQRHHGPLDRPEPPALALANLSALRARRLEGLAETYEAALEELRAWNDPAVAGLTARLETLHNQAIELVHRPNGAAPSRIERVTETARDLDRNRRQVEVSGPRQRR